MLTAITGINWGDEGKGRMVDLFHQSTTLSSVIREATMPVTPL
jgi:adenylosuccinate synthase